MVKNINTLIIIIANYVSFIIVFLTLKKFTNNLHYVNMLVRSLPMFATIGIIIDIVIIAILIIFSIIGLKKGFFKTVLSVFSWSVCLFIAIFTAKYVAGWINGLYNFSNLIGNGISKSLIKSNEFFAQSINVYQAGGKDALIAAIPGDVNALVKQLIKVAFSNTNVDMTSSDSIGSVVGLGLGQISMIVISGILVFIVLKIAIALLSKLFDHMSKTKIIGGLNRFLGMVLGLLRGALIIIVINLTLVGLSLVPTVNKLTTPIIQENTYVEKYIYKATDKLFGKYVIEGDTVKNWVEDLWEKR